MIFAFLLVGGALRQFEEELSPIIWKYAVCGSFPFPVD